MAADVGGTFTDMVAVEPDGCYLYLKLLSTPGEYDRAVCEGVDRLVAASADVASIDRLVHGTTVATNAVLERSGPPTGLLTTKGFRDVLEIARLRIPNSYDLFWTKPPPLARRRHRIEIGERIGSDGEVLVPLDDREVIEACERLRADGVRTIAISFVNGYANRMHEARAMEVVSQKCPDMLVTLGTAVVSEIGEFERTSTAVVNAYLRPVVSDYLQRLVTGMRSRGMHGATLIMQSSGGMMPLAEALEQPVHILESGPAAGALAAAHVARTSGATNVVAFDMGGTTAKASLIEDFNVLYGSEFAVGAEVSAMSRLLRGSGYTVRLPSIDLAEVGAGGGSIARVDAAGGVEVGPQSAGARPGPACYALGGIRATVTDADLLLGYVSADRLRAAGVVVDPSLAHAAIDRDVAGPLGVDNLAASELVHVVADQRMARAIRAVSTERGRDLATYTLIAFGGSGPIHAASLANAVGIRRVIVPPLAGVLSAVGLLWSPVQLTHVEWFGMKLADALTRVPQRRACAEQQLRARLVAAGAEVERLRFTADLDLRYAGQAHEISVALPPPGGDMGSIAGRFEAQHERTYGHAPNAPIELVRLRLTGKLAEPQPRLLRSAQPSPPTAPSRSAVFGGKSYEVAVLERAALDRSLPGPCLVDDLDTTTVVPPSWTVRRDEYLNLVLERTS